MATNRTKNEHTKGKQKEANGKEAKKRQRFLKIFGFSLPLFRSSLLACFLCARLLVQFVAIMSKTGEVIIEKDNSNNGGNFDAFDNPHEEPTILHTKKFRIGSGNIIGKGVIQDFFTCAGALPIMGGSILHRTSSVADAISLLIVELER